MSGLSVYLPSVILMEKLVLPVRKKYEVKTEALTHTKCMQLMHLQYMLLQWSKSICCSCEENFKLYFRLIKYKLLQLLFFYHVVLFIYYICLVLKSNGI